MNGGAGCCHLAEQRQRRDDITLAFHCARQLDAATAAALESLSSMARLRCAARAASWCPERPLAAGGTDPVQLPIARLEERRSWPQALPGLARRAAAVRHATEPRAPTDRSAARAPAATTAGPGPRHRPRDRTGRLGARLRPPLRRLAVRAAPSRDQARRSLHPTRDVAGREGERWPPSRDPAPDRSPGAGAARPARQPQGSISGALLSCANRAAAACHCSA